MAVRLQDGVAEARLRGRLGAVHAEMGQAGAAVAAAEKALALAEALDETSLVGEQQALLAFAQAELEQPDIAAEYARQAIATYRNSGDQGMREKAEQLLEMIVGERGVAPALAG